MDRGDVRRPTARATRHVALVTATVLGVVALTTSAAATPTAVEPIGAPQIAAPHLHAEPPTAKRAAARVHPPPASLGRGWTYRWVSAGGVTQWLACRGTGPVTVVVIAGLHADHSMWRLVLPGFARLTRTCIADRPGLGDSPPRHRHRIVDAGLHADELHALLVAARIPAPYVVIGHSYGGLVARAFVARYRSLVAGLMLMEGVVPYDNTSHYWHEGGDAVDTWSSSREAAPMRLGSIPLVVLAAQDPDRSYWGGPSYGETAGELADWRAHQQAAARLSTQSTFLIVAHSAHVIEVDRPDATVAALRLLVTSIVHHSHLPSCSLAAYGSQPLCR